MHNRKRKTQLRKSVEHKEQCKQTIKPHICKRDGCHNMHTNPSLFCDYHAGCVEIYHRYKLFSSMVDLYFDINNMEKMRRYAKAELRERKKFSKLLKEYLRNEPGHTHWELERLRECVINVGQKIRGQPTYDIPFDYVETEVEVSEHLHHEMHPHIPKYLRKRPLPEYPPHWNKIVDEVKDWDVVNMSSSW
jgi:hypothetical protein